MTSYATSRRLRPRQSPFNISDWGGEAPPEDARWAYGTPPAGNANFAWLQHIVHHLALAGVAGVVLANGSMSSTQNGESAIRQALIEGVNGAPGVVDCMVALPGQLFYSTQIPACLWFLARDKSNGIARKRQAARSAGRDPVHRRPQAWPHGGPDAEGVLGRGRGEDRTDLSRVARGSGCGGV